MNSLKEHAEKVVSEEEWENRHKTYIKDAPRSKEYYFLRKIFESHFPSLSAQNTVPKELSIACSTPEAIHWNPEWKDIQEISGRAI